MGGGRDHVRVRHGVGVHASGNQPGVVGHVHHENRADRLGNFGKALKVNPQAVGRCACNDQFGFGFVGFALHRVVINFLFFIQTIRHDIEPLAADVQRHAVRQMPTFGQAHAHDGVAGL